MNTTIFQSSITTGLIVLAIAYNSIGMTPHGYDFVCSNYVLNTYLYFLLSWSVVLATLTGLEEQHVKVSDLFTGLGGIFQVIVMVGLLSLVVMLPSNRYFITKHALYLALMVSFGMLLYPQFIKDKPLFIHAGLYTMAMFVILSVLSVVLPSMLEGSIGNWLSIGLTVLIVARLIEFGLVIWKPEWVLQSKTHRILAYASLLLFTGFTLYDTQSVLENARRCGKTLLPDYLNESMGLFLDALNMLTGFMDLDR